MSKKTINDLPLPIDCRNSIKHFLEEAGLTDDYGGVLNNYLEALELKFLQNKQKLDKLRKIVQDMEKIIDR